MLRVKDLPEDKLLIQLAEEAAELKQVLYLKCKEISKKCNLELNMTK